MNAFPHLLQKREKNNFQQNTSLNSRNHVPLLRDHFIVYSHHGTPK